ncbi:response regulator transcription factor [Malaciobacter canalis]|uniref:response regulator transcription factor n=1 Tax=Malaciobacter canalis TaxID=1912871 RepID=UPI00384CE830
MKKLENSSFNINFIEELTVLYVEDDSVIRKNLLSCFEPLFKKTYVAIDGKDGFEKFKKYKDKIDIVITDINMPNIDGIEMIKLIKNINPRVACLITTAYSDKQYLLDSINYGVNHYILKPFKIDTLLKEVEKSYLSTYYVKELSQRNREIEQLSKIFNSNIEPLELKELEKEDKEYKTKLTLFSEIIQMLDRR